MGADQIVSGGMPKNQYNSPGALIADQITGLLGVVTTAQGIVTPAVRIANIAPQTALSAITTPQNLFTQVMAAGTLNQVGRTLRVRGTVIYSTTSANVATITIAIKLGAVILCSITTAATNTAASANLPIQFEFLLTVVTAGSAGMINAHGSVTANIGTVAGAVATTYLDTNTAAQGPVDLTVAQTLAVTIAASAAVPSAQLLSATIDIPS